MCEGISTNDANCAKILVASQLTVIATETMEATTPEKIAEAYKTIYKAVKEVTQPLTGKVESFDYK